MMSYGEVMTARPQFTERECAALIALENNSEFKVFTEFIAKRAISVALLSTEKTGEQCQWLQGRAQELKDLSNCIKKARENFEALRKKGGK